MLTLSLENNFSIGVLAVREAGQITWVHTDPVMGSRRSSRQDGSREVDAGLFDRSLIEARFVRWPR